MTLREGKGAGEPASAADLGDDGMEAIGLGEAVRCQRDLYLYWREAHTSDGLPLTTRGYVTRPALRRVREAYAGADTQGMQREATEADRPEAQDLRLFYLRRLLERLGLLRQAAAAPRLVAAERGEMARFLAHPLAERLRICAQLWVAGGWWPDRADPDVELPHVLAPAPPRIALARRRLLETLGARAPGERVEIPLSPLPTGWGRRPRLGKRATATGQDAEGETLRPALLGPLAWMGFVAPETAEEPSACRAGIALRALAPDGDTDPLVEHPGRVVAQPDFSLVAYPPLTAPLLLALDMCAEAVSLDVVARYRLTREALGRAHRAGLGAEEVTRRLEAVGGAPLPGNVATTLGDWERHAERLRLTLGVSLLEVRNADLLDALLADRTARGWLLRRLTPTAALLVPEQAPSAREWLLRRGEFPAWRHG